MPCLGLEAVVALLAVYKGCAKRTFTARARAGAYFDGFRLAMPLAIIEVAAFDFALHIAQYVFILVGLHIQNLLQF